MGRAEGDEGCVGEGREAWGDASTTWDKTEPFDGQQTATFSTRNLLFLNVEDVDGTW